MLHSYFNNSWTNFITPFISEQNQPSLTSDVEYPAVSSHLRASWFTQFRILSDRTFKNLYRNPMLMLTHYCISVYLARKYISILKFIIYCLFFYKF